MVKGGVNVGAKRESEFDGSVFVAVEGDMRKDDSISIGVNVGDGARKVRREVVEWLGVKGIVRGVGEGLSSGRLKRASDKKVLRESEEKLNGLYELIKGEVNGKILEVLAEGRLKVGVWVDSEGGYVNKKNILVWAFDEVFERDGIVKSFVGDRACSAAFDVVFEADSILALEHSLFKWHFAVSKTVERLKFASLIKKGLQLPSGPQEQIDELECNFVGRAVGSNLDLLKNEVRLQLGNEKNFDASLKFMGRQLGNFGVLEVVGSRDELVKRMEKYMLGV